jgi:drug/metabolite transporter (DMT)-like permease
VTGSNFAAAALGLASALSWGISDFTGGLLSRRAGSLITAIALNSIGIVLAVACAVWRAEPFPTPVSWLWGAAAGVIGSLGLLALYQAMVIGKMGIAAPVTGVVAAVVPVVFGALFEGLPDAHRLAGFGLALVSVWLVSSTNGRFSLGGELGLALIAGVGFGAFYVLIDRATGQGVFWPLVAAKVAATLALAGINAVRRQPWTPGRLPVLPMLLLGVADIAGNVFFALGARAGRLDVAAVLASMYPLITVLCAQVFLKERMLRTQAVGVAMALAAIPLIAG